LPTLPTDRRTRWTGMLLVLVAIMMAWSTAPTLAERFANARGRLLRWYPGRRRPGGSYHGFIDRLARHSRRLARAIGDCYRGHVRQIAEQRRCWWVGRFVPMTVDGSKIDLPMTLANEKRLGSCSKDKSWPQMLLTVVQHLGTGLPWAFKRGHARSSERRHLLGMLDTLPKEAILVADAGFIGFEFWRRIMASNRSFLIRVGSNVKLIKKLGLAAENGQDDLVWVWPQDQQKKRASPLLLRWIRITDGRGRTMHLLSNVRERDAAGLSDETARQLYAMRWGVELLYRSMKQTLQRRKMLSDSPRNARTELTWAFIGLWTLLLIKATRTSAALKTVHAAQGVAAVRAVLNQATTDGVKNVDAALLRLEPDTYERKRSRKARHWPHKKTESPPGEPKARNATEAEKMLAEELAAERIAA
jgi:IS4 transposase